jgi:chemotaxis protein CheD
MVAPTTTPTFFSPPKELIKMGDLILTRTPEKYQVLGIGSCLAILVYDLRHGLFTIAHAILPDPSIKLKGILEGPLPALYVVQAIRTMVRMMKDNGSRRRIMQCKLIGGAHMLTDDLFLGKLNIQAALKQLDKEQIEIVGIDVGGSEGRAILDFNSNGSIRVRKGSTKFEL